MGRQCGSSGDEDATFPRTGSRSTVRRIDVFGKRLPRELEKILSKAEENCERAERILAGPPFAQRPKLRLVVDNEN